MRSIERNTPTHIPIKHNDIHIHIHKIIKETLNIYTHIKISKYCTDIH